MSEDNEQVVDEATEPEDPTEAEYEPTENPEEGEAVEEEVTE